MAVMTTKDERHEIAILLHPVSYLPYLQQSLAATTDLQSYPKDCMVRAYQLGGASA